MRHGEQMGMPKCFCGCGDDIGGFGPRGANKMGLKTVPVNDKLRAARALVSERHANNVYDKDPRPILALIDKNLARGAHWAAFWADFAHGGKMESTAAYREDRREWYEWTRSATAFATAASLMPEQMRAMFQDDRAEHRPAR